MSHAKTTRIFDTGIRPAHTDAPGVELRHAPALLRRPLEFDARQARRLLRERCHIVFYSRFAVGVVVDRDIIDEPACHRYWAVGQKTADVLRERLDVDVDVPPREHFDDLRRMLSGCGEPLPIVAFGLLGTHRDLSDPARHWSVDFTTIAVYESAPRRADELRRSFDAFRPHWLTVTSSRGAEAVADAIGIDRLRDLQTSGALEIAAIGPSTAKTLEQLGLSADLVPEIPDRDALVTEISHHPTPNT